MAAEPISKFNARSAAGYERSMGRWSRRMAPGVIAYANIGSAKSVIDVGCGTGSLLFELAKNPKFDRIFGIDASEEFIAAAREASSDPRIDARQGDAAAMPYADNEFDAALSQLVLQFVPDPVKALSEMRRITKPGGVVTAAVWNSFGGRSDQRMFWDLAAMLDPVAAKARNANCFRPMTGKGDITRGMQAVGLQDITESITTITMDFENFADYWSPIAAGDGTLGKYATSLDPAALDRLRVAVMDAYLAGQPDGERNFACTAQVARGIVIK